MRILNPGSHFLLKSRNKMNKNQKYKRSSTHQILMFIRDHPEGVKRQDVIYAFPFVPVPTIDGSLARLRVVELVYNDGTMGAKGSTWFPVTHKGVKEPFPTIARTLVLELGELHYDRYELHLAKRLQELFG